MTVMGNIRKLVEGKEEGRDHVLTEIHHIKQRKKKREKERGGGGEGEIYDVHGCVHWIVVSTMY